MRNLDHWEKQGRWILSNITCLILETVYVSLYYTALNLFKNVSLLKGREREIDIAS